MTSVIFLLFKSNLPNTHERNKKGGGAPLKLIIAPAKWIELSNFYLNFTIILYCLW